MRIQQCACVCMYDKIHYNTHICIYSRCSFFPDPDKPEGYDEPHSQQTRISKRSVVKKTKVYFGRIVTTLVHVPLVPRVSISRVSPCIVCLGRGGREGDSNRYAWINLKTAGQSNFTSAFVKLNLNEARVERNVTGEGANKYSMFLYERQGWLKNIFNQNPGDKSSGMGHAPAFIAYFSDSVWQMYTCRRCNENFIGSFPRVNPFVQN